MKRHALAAAAVVLALAAAVHYYAAPAASLSRSAEITAALKARVDAAKSKGMVVGTIDADGSTSMGAYGDPGPGALPLDGDSVFEIGSITKVFTGILLAEMVDRGEGNSMIPSASTCPPKRECPSAEGIRSRCCTSQRRTRDFRGFPTISVRAIR
jgi:serine-type D-Ala-D-Ala carboxypeptidase/endopeptidase